MISPAFAQLCSWENLVLAWRKAARGKRGTASVARFEYRAEEQLSAIREQLLAGTYRPGAYVHFHVKDPKRRKISAIGFRDRVVHHALCTVIEPRFERLFIPDSYANRKAKGTHRAIDRLQALRAAVSLRPAGGHRAALRVGRSRDPAGHPRPADPGGGRHGAGRSRSSPAAAACSTTNTAMCAFPATTCFPSAGRGGCRSAISPRSSGPTATCIPSISS